MAESVSICDWILLAFLVLSLFYGWRQGTVNVVGKVGSVVLAYMAARRYSTVLAVAIAKKISFSVPQVTGSEDQALRSFLSLFFNTDQIVNGAVQTIASVIIFVAVSWLIRRIARLITSAFGRGLLGRLNRALGAVLALFVAVLIIIVLVEVVAPALNGMGLTEESSFFAQSTIVVPLLQSLSSLL